MQAITTIGLDIAKPVFQVHGVDADGNVSSVAEAAKRSKRARCARFWAALIGACRRTNEVLP
jgi:hypothetical protein